MLNSLISSSGLNRNSKTKNSAAVVGPLKVGRNYGGPGNTEFRSQNKNLSFKDESATKMADKYRVSNKECRIMKFFSSIFTRLCLWRV